MFKKDIYKYKDEKGRTIVSPYKPNVEYEHMYRLIAQSDDYRLTNYSMVTQAIDIQEKDLELWFEVHKDDLETPISQNEQVQTQIKELNKIGKMFAKQITDDAIALELQSFYDKWEIGHYYNVGEYIIYNEVLYKILNSHTSQENWTPDATPSLYANILTSINGTPLDWVQPDSTNPYMIGDKVIYNGNIYESTIDNNIWSPDAYPQGWKQIENN